jgi:hypothetical protein
MAAALFVHRADPGNSLAGTSWGSSRNVQSGSAVTADFEDRVRVVPVERCADAVELERPPDVRVPVVTAKHPVDGAVRVAREVEFGGQLEF